MADRNPVGVHEGQTRPIGRTCGRLSGDPGIHDGLGSHSFGGIKTGRTARRRQRLQEKIDQLCKYADRTMAVCRG